jgi:2'-5' RNA ligase
MNLYFVLNIPPPFADRVMGIRRSQKDNFFASLPVEITLAGSTGVGVVDQAQNLPDAYKALDAIAEDTAPIETAFGKVVRFPGSEIFALTLEDDEPFAKLHQRIVKSGIKFHQSPHRFQPHCTLSNKVPLTKAAEQQLLALRVPGRFTLDALSVCRLDRPPVTLLHTAPLARKAA